MVMFVLEEPRRSMRKKGHNVSDDGFYYGDILAEDDVVLAEDQVMDDISPSREEEFFASVLLMIKKEESTNTTEDTSKIRSEELTSQGCDECSWKRLVCPPHCPNRKIEHIIKLSDEENSQLDGEPGSSSVDEENGIRYYSDAGDSSDELFDDINDQRKGNRSLPSSSNATKTKKTKKEPNRIEIHGNCSNQIHKLSRGAKRKTDLYLPDNGDIVSQTKRKYSKQRKVIKGIEMFWNAPTESYGLAKPKSPEQYEAVVRWSLSQLPRRCGTIEEVTALIKEYGWPELKKGNTREVLICKNTIKKILLVHFVERTFNETGEVVYSLPGEEDENVDIEEDTIPNDESSKVRSCSRHKPEEKCSFDCPFKNSGITLRKREFDAEDRSKDKSQRKPKREMRKRAPSIAIDDGQEDSWWTNELEEDLPHQSNSLSGTRRRGGNSSKKTSTSTNSNQNAGRGRRWVRFACEKHRREHARCPDNCPMRKKSYVENDTNDDMEMESQEHTDSHKIQGDDEVIVDESSLDSLP